MSWIEVPLRGAVRLIDYLLRLSHGLVEIGEDPEFILRIQLSRASHALSLGSESISKGDPVLALHAWNERMPKLPAEGATMQWALLLRRQVILSFRQVAKLIKQDQRYSSVCAVCGTSALFSFTDHLGGTRLMQHLGFTVLPYHRPMGKFGEFWENLFSWWLMWTYNQASLDRRLFFRLQRTEIWMSKDEFLRRYGDNTDG